MLYLIAIDDADVRHATSSTANPQPVCGHPTGATRLVWDEQHTFDATSSTSVTSRKPAVAKNPASLAPTACPECV